MINNTLKNLSILSLVTLLAACSGDKDKSVLEGDRLSLYDFEKSLQADPNTQFGLDGSEDQATISLPDELKGGKDEAISLVAPWDNKFWPQAGGYANHSMKHVAFNEAKPERQWSHSIGRGATGRMPLTAAPIMADGMVFALNSKAEVTAVNAQDGREIWNQDILKKGEDEVVIGGGLAFSGGRVFATNGFNELLALDAKTGNILWRVDTKTPVRSAPAAIPSRVFVTTMDNETLAFDAANGHQLWSHRGLNSDAAVLGAATPALTRDAVITAYSSGEIYALQIDTGMPLWNENLSPLARAAGQADASDIRALPVVDSGVVYAASYSSRMSAIEARSGQQIWQVSLGTGSTPWISGNRIFMIESQGTLLSMNRENGQFVWQTALPRYEDPEDREDVITWLGPVLAGGRLMVFGSNGQVREYSPVDGSSVREWAAGSDISLPPAIADQTLYIVDNSGRLSAWK